MGVGARSPGRTEVHVSADTESLSLVDRTILRAASASPWLAALVLAAMVATVWVLVQASGGSETAMPHLFYLPIILATVPFGLRGSLATAAVAAVVVGPFMPLDVATGEAQEPVSWLIRGAVFLAVGSVASASLAVRERFYDQQLTSELRSAITHGVTGPILDRTLLPLVADILTARRFHPVYQPIYSLTDGSLLAVEALTRFDAEPSRTPDIWFAAAAEVGLGVDLEIAAIEEALAGVADLDPSITLSVNASPATLADPRLLDLVRVGTGRAITVEVTEHAVIEDYHLLKSHLAALRREGVLIAVDDAGAGVASMQHIVQLTPEVIKLDISLTQHVGSSPFRRALAGALIDFAHGSGALLVVEGIEEEADLEIWTALGAHAVQGYLVGRPGPLPPHLSSPLIAGIRTY